MENNKALDILKRLKIGTVMTKVDGDRVFEPLCMAIEALEKQTSKEVDTDTINKGMNVTGEYDIESNMLCPNCKVIVGNYESEELYFDYCPNCGQKLKFIKS